MSTGIDTISQYRKITRKCLMTQKYCPQGKIFKLQNLNYIVRKEKYSGKKIVDFHQVRRRCRALVYWSAAKRHSETIPNLQAYNLPFV